MLYNECVLVAYFIHGSLCLNPIFLSHHSLLFSPHWWPLVWSLYPWACFFFVIYIFIYFRCWRSEWQSTPVFLPGKFHGQGSLVGFSPWGRKELDMTEHTVQYILDFRFQIYVITYSIWFSLTYFLKHDTLLDHSFCYRCHNFILFYGWVIFHCVYIHHIFFIHSSVDGCLRLLPYLGDCK